ncbi:MAG: CocE/NonD family hydrolase [Alphaproteobacteria bacterium]|nr:CocE/NonD family hydrolase [Alphaproteobacteria bacterium]
MRTRDGARLDADVYRPVGQGPFPVLLMRQPYGRRIASTVVYAHPRWYASHGYIVAIQDVRGAGTSEGLFKLFENEREDGADALAWAAALEGGNGRVGMYGFSYQAATQLLALAGALDGGGPTPGVLCPAMMGWDVYSDWAYEGGAFCLQGDMSWALQVGAERARLAGDSAAFVALRAAARTLPLNEERTAWPAVLQRYGHYTHYADWIGNSKPGGYWDRISPRAALHGRTGDVPMLHVGGWYDPMLEGTLGGFRDLASSPARQRLIVGPWGHIPWGRRAGIRDFGPEASSPIDIEQLRWFDRFLKNHDNGVDREPPVRLFDTGANRWRDFDGWPDAPPEPWHITSSGLAAARSEDGRLVREAPAISSIDMLVHDPWRPVPSLGGHDGQPPGPQDRSALDQRTDVACYTSPPIAKPMTLAGRVHAEIHVEADAPSHDLAAILSQVTPDGRAVTLTQGYLRAADSKASGPHLVSMRALCATIPAGSALRLSLQAASFPAFVVNPGTGVSAADARPFDSRVITLTLHGGGPRSSRLLLPVGSVSCA